MKSEEFEYEIRIAKHEDVDAIIRTALEFWHESDHSTGKAPPDPKAYADFIHKQIDEPGKRCIIAVDEHLILGYIMIYACPPDYAAGLDGDMYQFFTHPRARGTGIARELIEMSEQTQDDWGCTTSYASISAEIGEKEMMQCRNLFAKFGYEVTGVIMTKRR